MKTNPEEFIKDEWGRMIREYWEYMLPEDKTTYTLAYNAMMQDQFTEMVMKKLAGAVDDGVSLNSVSHNDINPLNSYQELRRMGQINANPYQNNPNHMYGQQGLRVSTQSDDINQFYSSPSIEKAKAEGNLLSQIAKRMGRK
jgi:hypothetical protein